jgi:hypothetical protein
MLLDDSTVKMQLMETKTSKVCGHVDSFTVSVKFYAPPFNYNLSGVN